MFIRPIQLLSWTLLLIILFLILCIEKQETEETRKKHSCNVEWWNLHKARNSQRNYHPFLFHPAFRLKIIFFVPFLFSGNVNSRIRWFDDWTKVFLGVKKFIKNKFIDAFSLQIIVFLFLYYNLNFIHHKNLFPKISNFINKSHIWINECMLILVWNTLWCVTVSKCSKNTRQKPIAKKAEKQKKKKHSAVSQFALYSIRKNTKRIFFDVIYNFLEGHYIGFFMNLQGEKIMK